MQAPETPADEVKRLARLRALKILDTPPEERFDRITRIAARTFGVPITLVSLVDSDRQWFKSRHGLDAHSTSRDVSFCGHAILHDEVLQIEDATLDDRFVDNPLVVEGLKIRFYAGAPLLAGEGSAIGTLCLIDQKPRRLDADDLALLRDFARLIEGELQAVELAATLVQLDAAKKHIDRLEDLLSICCYCKSVRDRPDEWDSIEGYLLRTQSLLASHGVCPKCYDEHIRPQLEELQQE